MRIRAFAVAVMMTTGALALLATPAAAHEELANGDLVMVVGFADEPAYAGQPNAAEITFTHDGHAVTDVKGMTVTVTSGDQESEPMDLEPGFFIEGGEVVFGTPGAYLASFVPSQPGTYEFHFEGTVDGEEVDEVFTSGPRTFSDVQDVAAAAFPPVTAPSNEDLASRIEQESTRAADSIAASEATAAAANDEASTAKTLGIVGIAVGALGLVVGIAGFAAARRRA